MQHPHSTSDAPVLRLQATDLSASLVPGQQVTSWASAVGDVVAGACGDTTSTAAPVFTGDAVRFDGASSALCGALTTGPSKTIVVVIDGAASPRAWCPVYHDETYRGLVVGAADCTDGYPQGSGACDNSSKNIVSIDWSGSSNAGWRDVHGELAVVSVVYGERTASSFVDRCAEQDPGSVVNPIATGSASTFAIGSRLNGYGRFFKGDVHELLVYDRALETAELMDLQSELLAKYGVPERNCSIRVPLDCAGLQQAGIGPSDQNIERLKAFVSSANAAGLAETLLSSMAGAALRHMDGFNARCEGLNSGAIAALRRNSSNVASVNLLLQTATQLLDGINNLATLYQSAAYDDPIAKQLASLWTETRVPFEIVL